ncbi:hypothetical protein [Streptomyces oceani]|uniref:hypothetical protein n=1 Tax=Streptomyces oceani TaxID=1075402 RepID=UPI001112D79E|nr:hypothetical protein [Streptomyces oceani]
MILAGVAGLAVVGLVLFVGLLGYHSEASDDVRDSRSDVSCSKALSFAHGTLPEDASEADCTRADGIDVFVSGRFRMPRADVRGWLDTHYPQAERRTSCEEDLCLERSYASSETEGAYEVRLTVGYVGADSAHVTLEAFTT